MGKIGFIGGFAARDVAGRILAQDPPRTEFDGGWCLSHGDSALFLEGQGGSVQTFDLGEVKVLVWGQLKSSAEAAGTHLSSAVAAIVGHYVQSGSLPVNQLVGSFALALLDRTAGRIVLYRNLFGSGFVYYTLQDGNLLFGTNVADLIERGEIEPQPNSAVLPALFLYRSVPGRETLFAGIHRLMPGELLSFDGATLSRTQRQTFADLLLPSALGSESLSRVEEAISDIVADYGSMYSRVSNLLSGGVDSSYLQSKWNESPSRRAEDAQSFAVVVDHPRTRLDAEYAVTAARALGVELVRVSADAPYSEYLVDTIAGTGEPPNHVQAAYFGHLARTMAKSAVGAGICGQGADSLFGVGAADLVRLAWAFRRFLPIGGVRSLAASLAGMLGKHSLPAALRLADRIHDDTRADHPLNQFVAFYDAPSVIECFGRDAVSAALEYRRSLLDQFDVPSDPLQRLHAMGFLGDSIDSTSLWKTLFNREGVDLFCPFLDSRIFQVAINIRPDYRFRFRRPKDLLKQALSRRVPSEIVHRKKLAFGQPIFEWMAPGGQLRPLVDQIGEYDFVPRDVLARARERPNWFLYTLLCYDIWHKVFIDGQLTSAMPVAFNLRRA